MNFIKKVWNKIKNPHGVWLILFYIAFVAVVSSTIVLLVLDSGLKYGVLHYVLWGLSAVALTYFVYSVVVLAPKMKNGFVTFLRKFKFTNALLDNFGYRTIIFSIFSFILNMSYVVLQGVLAIITGSVWYISITAYYLVLSLMKGNIFYSLKKHNTPTKRARAYRYCGIMFIFLTLALSGIIVLIYTSNMYFEYAGLMIYVVAAYTFYNLTMSIINIFKARRQDNLYVQSIRNVNLVASLVSIVVLQVAMFQAFSPENNTSIANGLTGGGVSALILLLGIFMIVKANIILSKITQNPNLTEAEIDVFGCVNENNENNKNTEIIKENIDNANNNYNPDLNNIEVKNNDFKKVDKKEKSNEE